MDSGLQLGTKIFLCPIRDKNSNELQNCFVKCSIPGPLSPVFKTFAAVFPDPTDRPWVSDDGSPQDTRDGVDLYIAQASFAWPRVDLARPLRGSSIGHFCILFFKFGKVCWILFSSLESFIGFHI